MTTPLWTGVPALLDDRFPLPLDAPFSVAMARRVGVSRHAIERLLDEGLIRRMLKGVYAASQARDGLLLRAAALALVVPEHAVVTDWTACWAWTGLLPFGEHLEVPPVTLFRHAGEARLRNRLCDSGERSFTDADLTVVDGVTFTTRLRTALDIGRLTRRDEAIVGLDGLLRSGLSHPELLDSVELFRRQRGVRQLRVLAPIADPRAESPGESVLRLRWLDLAGMPPPTPQIPIFRDGVEVARLDLGNEELMFAVEYDGAEFHSSDEDVLHDRSRRSWLSDERDWLIKAVGRKNLFGGRRDIERILSQGVREARRRLGRPWL